jgi:hypothetical protein
MSRSIYISPITDPASLTPGTKLLLPRTLNPGDYQGVIATIHAGSLLEVAPDTFQVCRPGEVLVRTTTPVGTKDTLALPARVLSHIDPNPFTHATRGR